MLKKLATIFLLLHSFSSGSEDPRKLLEETISIIGSGAARNWTNREIGEKLRVVRNRFSQTPESISAAALLAFHLSQIPGDYLKETHELCDEVTLKAPHSWQAWVANCARVATWGHREGENQKTLDAALDALKGTNGEGLSKDPDPILKPLMDQWPPISTDFTDIFNSVITQQALVLERYDLAKTHLLKIVNPRLRATGERRIRNYLEHHPREFETKSRDRKTSIDSANDQISDTNPDVGTLPPKTDTQTSSDLFHSGRIILFIATMTLVTTGGFLFYRYLITKRL